MAQTAVINREKHVKIKIPVINSSSIAPEQENGNLVHRLWGKWRAHTIMFLTLFAGAATALGHHFMNVSLNETQVDQAKLSQAWASRFSTSLAFLVQFFFATSVGVAFVQRQWLNFHHNPYKVDEVDSLTGILGNIFDFFGDLVWLRNPMLTMVAIIAWQVIF
jgi:hypothetical protein